MLDSGNTPRALEEKAIVNEAKSSATLSIISRHAIIQSSKFALGSARGEDSVGSSSFPTIPCLTYYSPTACTWLHLFYLLIMVYENWLTIAGGRFKAGDCGILRPWKAAKERKSHA